MHHYEIALVDGREFTAIGTIEATDMNEARDAYAAAHNLDPATLSAARMNPDDVAEMLRKAASPAHQAAPVSDERSRMIDTIYARARHLTAPRSKIEAMSDEELHHMYAHYASIAAIEAKPDEVLRDQMKHKTSMRRVNQPALEPAGVLHMRSRRSGRRRFRANVWDPSLQVTTHLGVYDTQEEADAVKAAARQRIAMGLPVRID